MAGHLLIQEHNVKKAIINIFRIIVAVVFILSGFVKAVDPLGTQYKLQDYAEALGVLAYVPEWLLLVASIALAAFEFLMGIALLFAISRRLVTKALVAFMVVMTATTVWIYIDNPVSDCGCFGDAVTLTNGQTLLKNIVLLAMALVMAWRPLHMPRMVSLSNQWIVSHYSVVFVLGISLYSLYLLPVFDFRPYHVGASIREGMKIPEGAEQPEFETTFIMEKDGEQREFDIDHYPDSTWTFVDSKTKVLKEGYVPPIHDFNIQRTEDGEDITDMVLDEKGYTFLLIAPYLEKADDSNFGRIDLIYEYANDNGYPFYCLTASGEKAIEHWKDITGAEYEFCNTDPTTLKTIIRSNPGLIIIKDGTVVGKWSHNELPAEELTQLGKLSAQRLQSLQTNTPARKITYILLWFVLPLTFLVIADRLWMWSIWLKLKETKHSNKLIKHLKTKHNGKENCSRQLEDEQEPAGGRCSR